MDQFALVGPHVAAGGLALAAFWATLLSRKGSGTHRWRGRVYLLLLVPLVASVVPIVAREGADPARLAQLAYLALVVATAGWTAWRAVRDRADPARFRGPVFRALAAAMAAAGSALMLRALVAGDALALGFSAIGVVYGGAMLGFLGREAEPGWWLRWHLNGVALLFAATHASFVGLLARTLWPGLSGEPMHALTQIGTIAFAYGFRQWLGVRYDGFPARPRMA